MAVTPGQLKIRYPVFDSLEDSTIQMVIDDVELELDETTWGRYFDRACTLLVAHMLAVEDHKNEGEATETSRRLSSESFGDSSESYANPENQLEETVFGREYLRLARRVLPHGVTV